MDENAKSPNDAKTLKRLEITDSTVLTGDIIGARGEYSSVEEIVIRGSIIRLNDEYTYNAARLAAAKRLPLAASTFRTAKSIVGLQSTRLSATVHNPNPMVRAVSAFANSQVSVRNELFGPAIGAAYGSSGGQINILIENSTVTAKGGNLRSGTDYIRHREKLVWQSFRDWKDSNSEQHGGILPA